MPEKIEVDAALLTKLLEDARQREEEARQREEEARQREENARRREEETRKYIEKRDEEMRSLMALLLAKDAHPASTVLHDTSNSISQRIPIFYYQADEGRTFESWYRQFTNIVNRSGTKLSDEEKAGLLTGKLDGVVYKRFEDKIKPRTSEEVPFEETVTVLTALFGEKKSLFQKRWEAFTLQGSDDEEMDEYRARMNGLFEDAKLTDMSLEEFKTLFTIFGMAPKWSKIRARLQVVLATKPTMTVEELRAEWISVIITSKDTEIGRAREVQLVQKNTSRKKPPLNKEFTEKKTACYICGEPSHYANVCPSRQRGKTSYHRVEKKNEPEKKKIFKKNVKRAHVNSAMVERMYLTVRILDQDVRLQLDTGSDITMINKATWKHLRSPKLEVSNIKAKSAGGTLLRILGKFEIDFEHKGHTATGTCYVTDNVQLIGLSWIQLIEHISQPIRAMCNFAHSTDIERKRTEIISHLSKRYANVFNDDLGCCTKAEAVLHVKQDARPVFVKARPVPYAAKENLDKELDRLVDADVLSKVDYSDWAAPVVCIRKPNGSIRLCADFSTGLNDCIETHQHPMPLPDDIFARLNGGHLFTQIDFADAYLQIPVSQESKPLLTISTHRGLYRYPLQPSSFWSHAYKKF